MPKFAHALLAGASVFAAASAFAEDSMPVPPIVVSATRNPTPLNEIASSMTVVTGEDIQNRQDLSLPDVLNNVPGLTVVQSGGEGGVASVFMRGTNSNHVKVLIDGIDASDPTAPTGAFDFSTILASDIERIEVLRGPQSSLYGSDAIGGVINIITKKGTGPAQFTASAEGGSYNSFNQTVGASGSISRFNYNVGIDHMEIGAVPVTPTNLLAPGTVAHDDHHNDLTLSSRLGADITDDLDIGLVTRYVENKSLTTGDDDFAPFTHPDPLQSESRDKELFTRATAHQTLFNGGYEQTFGLGYTGYHREDFIPNNDPEFNYGDRIKADWQGNIKLAKGETGVLGAEHQIDELSSPVSAQMRNNAGFAELQSQIGERFFNAVSIRVDDNDRFGEQTTYRIAPAVLFPETGTKLKASYGTSFKAPTLNELFVSYPAFGFNANPDLKPEKSVGYDLGFEQSVFAARVKFGSTWFHNHIKNLIAANDAFTMDINIGHATTYGFENFVSYKPFTALLLRAAHTFTIAENDSNHEELIRRPKNKASVSATWQALTNVKLTGTALYVGPWIDGNRDFSVSRENAPGYTTFNIAADWDVKDNIVLYGRVDNLLNRHYQDPVGFQQPGLGIYAGIRTRF